MDAFTEISPLDNNKETEVDSEVNDALPEKGTTSSGTGKAQVKAVVGHKTGLKVN